MKGCGIRGLERGSVHVAEKAVTGVRGKREGDLGSPFWASH